MTAAIGSALWHATRLGYLFRTVSDKGHESATVLSVFRDHGVVPKNSRSDNFNRTPEDLGAYQLVKRGDLVVNRMKAWQGSLGISAFEGIVSPDYEVLRPTCVDNIDERYLHLLLRSRPLIDQYAVRSTGIRPSQWRLYWEQMKTIEVALPSAEEQRAIADFLDRETAHIDTLIAKQQQLIGCLHERRESVVTAALRGYAPTRLRRLVEPNRPMTYGILQAGENVAEGVPYIGPSDMPGEGESPALADLRRTSDEVSANYSRSLLKGGDVVVSIGPAYGKVALISEELEGANLTQDTVRVACDSRIVDSSYLVRAIGSRQAHDYWDSEIMGATFRRLNLGTLARTPIPLPSLDEQHRISAYLDEQAMKIDALIAKTERFIELAKERRTALITTAVTGQIDVRESA